MVLISSLLQRKKKPVKAVDTEPMSEQERDIIIETRGHNRYMRYSV